jgi:glycerol-3-phosphate O-acyltransferase/dihydroxyacetone phosphate acyltransferase
VDAFAACHQVLRAGGVVAVFPEGEASDAPHLLRVKTGAARIVLGARSHGVVGIRVVPVGLIYEAKQRARSRAFVRVGEPIAVDTEAAGDLGRGEEDRDAVRSLTHLIEARLAETSLDYRDAAQAADLWFAASVSLRRLGGSPSWSPPLSSLEGCATALARASSDAQARVREAAADYRRALEAIDATDRGVAAGRRHGRDAVRAAAALATILALPFALVGASVNAVPALLVYLSGRRPAAPVTLATVKFLVALAVFPVTWLVVREWFVASASHPWLWTAILGPGCGLVAAVVADRIRRIRQARLLPARVVLPDRAADELLERRAWLVESVADALGR